MTPQEALRHFEEHLCKHCCEWDKSLRHCNACPTDTAKKALELQIPKKPIDNTEQEWFECPTCGRVVVTYHNGKRHHCRCGQSLKWISG